MDSLSVIVEVLACQFHTASQSKITCLWDENPSQLYFYTLESDRIQNVPLII